MDEGAFSRTSTEGRFDEASENLNWSPIRPRGKKPEPRWHHASAVIGRKMLIVGGDSGRRALNDVQLLHLGKLTWTELGHGSATYGRDVNSRSGSGHVLPPCRGHSLIPWGKHVLLVAGEMNPPTEKVEVWSFDTDSETWTKVSAKGEIPVARGGQTVTRAGSILVLFGGEDVKGRKLNDLHILDLKSLTWLPLHTTGTGPSPRARHTAAMYEDRFLFIFGGLSKSKSLNDIFSLDFESMEWSRLKTKGVTPGPRAGHAGVLIGDKWYITGGDSRGPIETFVLDLLQSSWSVVATSTADSVVANQGLSMQLVQRRDRSFLVAFGGRSKELSNEVQVLFIPPPDQTVPRTPPGLVEQASATSTPENARPSFSPRSATGLPCACVNVVESNVVQPHERVRAPAVERPSSQTAIPDSGLSPLRKRFAHIQDSIADDTDSMSSPAGLGTRRSQDRSIAEDPSREVLSHSEGSFCGSGEFPVHGLESPSGRDSTGNQDSWRSPTRASFSPSQRLKSADSILANGTSELVGNAAASGRSPEGKSALAMSGILGTGWSSKTARNLPFDPPGSPQLEDELDVEVAEELRHPDGERREIAIRKLTQNYERKLAAALRKHAISEGQLAVVAKGKEEVEKTLKTVSKSRQKAEDKLSAAMMEQHELKVRVEKAERAQEESNNLANIVHQENLRLEHDVAFLKAVLEDTQKELQTTRGVLAGERSRAFQLQVEVFELKQKLQALETGQTGSSRVTIST